MSGQGLYLEGQPCLDVRSKDFGDDTIEVGQNLHRQLRLDSPFVDQVIESISEG